MPRRSKKRDEARIEKAYAASCSGIQIDIMDIGKVFKVGQASIDDGDNDWGLGQRIRAYVETIRKN